MNVTDFVLETMIINSSMLLLVSNVSVTKIAQVLITHISCLRQLEQQAGVKQIRLL